ncbi:MAG: rane protein [Bacteroidetes bacterium]|jgi:hypothetical protein|nr:rane protein [Bacteroidota bacterium]
MKPNEKLGVGMKTITMMPEMDKELVKIALQSSLYKDKRRLRASFMQDEIELMAESAISTNGWDTVFAISAEHLNKAIIEKKSYPATIEYTITDGDESYSITNGKFNAWQISEGGDGSNINLKLPIASGSFDYGKGFELNGVEAIVQVKLRYFPEVLDDEVLKEGLYDLKVSTTSNNPDVPVVSLIQLNVPSSLGMGKITKSVLSSLILEWCNHNLDKFNTVFSTINLNSLGDKEDYKWLKSTHMSYAYTDNGTLTNSVFGVLCMTLGHSAVGLPRQITQNALTDKGDGTFIINTGLFAEYQFLPSLPFVFEDAKASDFTLNDTKNGITSSKLKMEGIKYGAITYHPVCESFEVFFEQTYIRSHTTVKTDISPGIVSIVDIDVKMTLKLDTNSAGEQILTYELLGDPAVISKTETEAWVVITEVIAGLILAVVGLVVGACMKTIVQKIIVGVIVAVIAAIISVVIHVIIEKVIAEGVSKGLPSIDPMVKVATNQIIWPLCDPADPNRFTLTSVTYNGSIALIGNPGYIK